MALQKEIVHPCGVSGDYVRIEALHYNRPQRILEVSSAVYLNREHAQNGAAPLASLPPLQLQGEAAEVIVAALHDLCGPLAYEALKGTETLRDAAGA